MSHPAVERGLLFNGHRKHFGNGCCLETLTAAVVRGGADHAEQNCREQNKDQDDTCGETKPQFHRVGSGCAEICTLAEASGPTRRRRNGARANQTSPAPVNPSGSQSSSTNIRLRVTIAYCS